MKKDLLRNESSREPEKKSPLAIFVHEFPWDKFVEHFLDYMAKKKFTDQPVIIFIFTINF
ncbi:hypothetical protein BpHYR1_033929 [Brachionus plicatilis]|uniref:Uncharacterized protein n=1 Tax=Brachionus plicatilis TaxID=10195 RepID=A0A3M7QMT8_BRAPC|nr:hypothetical protein BpHYR1_033929 [Brachionus plicatilis]